MIRARWLVVLPRDDGHWRPVGPWTDYSTCERTAAHLRARLGLDARLYSPSQGPLRTTTLLGHPRA